MSDRPYHKSLRLENFTAFADTTFAFVPGVNVFIGENGTGKTHAMKALYAVQLASSRANKVLYEILESVFQTEKLEDIVRLGPELTSARASGEFGRESWVYAVSSGKERGLYETGLAQKPERPVFIPAIDMMGHTKAFLAAANELVFDFDLTCTDIVALLGLQRKNGASHSHILHSLTSLLGGQLEYDEHSSRFYLATTLGRISMPLVAEGIRKISTLVRLMQNGWLLPGTTLFWDEPEVNLNPVLMDEIVGAILALAREGVQVFLATHSYVILKELDLQANRADSVRYFAFVGGEDGTTVLPTDDFALLDPNPILEQYDSLYDRDLTRSTGRDRHGEPVR